MQTSCPECRTAFRVSQEQLGLRRGLVRCGKCNAVFNAYDTLLPELAEPPIALPEAMPDALSDVSSDVSSDAAAPPELSQYGWDDEFTPAQPPIAGSNMETEDEVTLTGANWGEIAFDGAGKGEEAVAESMPTPAEETSESILLSELPNRRPAPPALPLWKRLSYLFAAIVLFVLLVFQIAYFLRAELVAALPASRPALELLCRPLGCAVPLPRELGRQAIAASNLEHDPEQKSRVRLTFLLTNRTGQTQAWPVVSLTLTDVREAPVAQKLFPPEAYLPKDADVRSGMADGSEREVRLELDIGNLAATGYALGLAYP
jgi:predicted Zn finger-like uncharacterized protein